MNAKTTLLIIGANGQLGRSIKAIELQYPNYQMTFINRQHCELSSTTQIEKFFATRIFNLIVNCAAYTAVDQAESEIKLANLINHHAVKILATIAKQQNAIFIHLSTDYVFNGEHFKPYTETDLTAPQSVYGDTKLKGEQALQAVNPKGLIIRTSWLYSEYGHNFLKTMLKLGQERTQLAIISDQIGTPTYARNLAHAILTIGTHPRLQQSHSSLNVYHYSNEGVSSWYDFAQAIFEQQMIQCQLQPIATEDYPTAAKRPHYSLLNKTKIKQHFHLKIPHWKEALQQSLTTLTD
jgi:dTDP-4-dehydrorhamnose reductase